MVRLKVITLLVVVLTMSFAANTQAECEGDVNCNGVVDGSDLALLAGSFGDADCPLLSNIDMSEYLPTVGMTRHYKARIFSSTDEIRESTCTTVWDGTQDVTTYEDGSKLIYVTSQDSRGYVLSSVKRFYPDNTLEYEDVHEPPIEYLWPSDNKSTGESWGGMSVLTMNDYDGVSAEPYDTSQAIHTRIYNLLAVEDISISAGDFPGCLKIYLTKGGGTTATVYWLAKDFGVVRKTMSASASDMGSSGYILELESFDQP